MVKGGFKLEINIPPQHISAQSKGGLIIEGGVISSEYGNCKREPERQFPGSSYNHNILKFFRTSVRESPAASGACKVPYCNFEVHL